MTDQTITSAEIDFLRAEMDRRAIMECLHRYTRGVDRADRALMLSAYHLDAQDEHGVANLGATAFVDWALGWHGEAQTGHQHIIGNTTLDVQGETAHGETYYTFWGRNRAAPPTLAFGRYIDRFEKRNGQWAIAHRVCVNELVGEFTETALPEAWAQAVASTGPVARGPEDVSYQRPLVSGLTHQGR